MKNYKQKALTTKSKRRHSRAHFTKAAPDFQLKMRHLPLINGASLDGGINQAFEEALKKGTFRPAGDPKNFKSYGAVSVNIGEWGGMMTSNRSVLVSDTPVGVWELKSNEKASSQNPLSVARAAQKAGGHVHIMLAEGGEIGLKEVLEYITNQHDPKTKALIHLGIGFDPTNPAKDKGIRGATFFANFLASHPELIEEMERKGIKLMAVDAPSGKHYASFKEYLSSKDWKTQRLKFKAAATEIEGKGYTDKKTKVALLEDRIKAEVDSDKKKQLNTQILTLKGEIALIENRVNSNSLIYKYLSENARSTVPLHDKALLEKMTRAAATNDTSSIRRSGLKVDPAEAAKKAAKGVR